MFNKIENNNLGDLSRAEFSSLNGFMSFSPLSWAKEFSGEWLELFKALEISVNSFNIQPMSNVKLPPAVTYSFILDQEESFLYISSLPLKEVMAKTKLLRENDQGLFLSDILAEYLVRKLLKSVINNWRGDIVPDFQFVGLEKSETSEVILEKVLGISFICSEILVQIFISIPEIVFDRFCSAFPKSSYLKIPDRSQESAEDHSIRLDYCSMGIPTKTLIDVLRQDGILNLPEMVAFDKVRVLIDEEVVCDGRLRNFSDELVVQFEESIDLRLPSLSAQQTLLTVSLGSMELSLKEAQEMPGVLYLNGLTFSRVQLLVGNEVVALGELGHDESGALVVRVE